MEGQSREPSPAAPPAPGAEMPRRPAGSALPGPLRAGSIVTAVADDAPVAAFEYALAGRRRRA